ncbi:hypothetical protein VST63_23130 [Mycolicibacterium sp. 050232]|uniref:hypothetical protein n=1 Tax=Mycolicibacterium sp. 050232 TaxID=3113982 RepID=UPI002E2D053B|nr:hypothetical protein [Mycolicibacterium sp. 050232]MED5815264.1 hypothetical protein [Mycolicibacterium sp. 050232]
MPTLDELFFLEPGQPVTNGTIASNPFSEDDALVEAQILEIRYDGIRSVLGVALEMRLAERITETSTALLLAHNVIHYSWNQTDRRGGRTAWTIISSSPLRTETGFGLELKTSPSGALSITANSASLYSVRISELEGTAPPDYGDRNYAAIRRGIANWASDVEVVGVSHS